MPPELVLPPVGHNFKTSFGQCCCRWCGRRGEACMVTRSMRRELARFAREHGRTWRSKLSLLWTLGSELSPELMQARNIIGPTQLSRIPNSVIARVEA